MDKNIIVNEFEVDYNLFYLESFLASLNSLCFDKETTRHLKKFHSYVIEKLYHQDEKPNHSDMVDMKLTLKVYYE